MLWQKSYCGRKTSRLDEFFIDQFGRFDCSPCEFIDQFWKLFNFSTARNRCSLGEPLNVAKSKTSSGPMTFGCPEIIRSAIPHRIPRHPERFRDSFHHGGGTHRGSLERQQAWKSPGVAGIREAKLTGAVDVVESVSVLYLPNDRQLYVSRCSFFRSSVNLWSWRRIFSSGSFLI